MLALESKIEIRTTPRLHAFYYQTKLPIYLFFLLKCLQLPVDYNLFHEKFLRLLNYRKNHRFFTKKSSFSAFKNGPIHLWKYFDFDEEHQGQRKILLVFGKFSRKIGLNFLGFSTFLRIFDISPRLNTQKT